MLFGLALVSYDLAARYLHSDWPWANQVLAGSVAMSLLTGWRVNLNYLSIHRYYRTG